MIKLVIVSALVATASAAGILQRTYYRQPLIEPTPVPVSQYGRISPIYNPQPGRYYAILRSNYDISPEGAYDYAFETENGIAAQQSGRLTGIGPNEGVAATGSFQWTSPEGVPVRISYIADQNGYQPVGNVLPTPPPTPEAILRSLAFNAANPETQTVLPFTRRQYYQK